MSTLALKCAEFKGHIAAGLLSMFESEQYTNVTIAVEGEYLKAHKMVLSICSPYFDALLQSNPCKHPIIFMKNVKFNIMQHLLRFMYEGQIDIKAEDFQLFIDTARELQVKWLTNCDEQNTEEASKNSAKPSREDRAAKRPRRSNTPEPNMKPLDITALYQELMDQCPPSCSSIDQPNISNSKGDVADTGSSDTLLMIEVEEDNRSNQEEIMETTCETLEGVNVNINSTTAESTTNTDTAESTTDTDRFFVEPIAKALAPEEDDDIEYIENEQVEELEEVIDLDDDEDDQLMQSMNRAPTRSLERTIQEGDPVNVLFYKVGKALKIYVNKNSYIKALEHKSWITWQCSPAKTRSCKATVILTNDRHIVFLGQHSHEPNGELPKKLIKNAIYRRTLLNLASPKRQYLLYKPQNASK